MDTATTMVPNPGRKSPRVSYKVSQRVTDDASPMVTSFFNRNGIGSKITKKFYGISYFIFLFNKACFRLPVDYQEVT